MRGPFDPQLPNGSRDTVAPNAIKESLNINAREVSIVPMGMQGRDMAARLEMMVKGVEGRRRFDLLLYIVSDAATAFARREDRLALELKRVRVVLELDGHS
jgi:hypothetical protein